MDMRKDSEDRAPIEFFIGVFFAGCALIGLCADPNNMNSIEKNADASWKSSDALMSETRKRMDAVEAAEGESHGTK